MDGDGMDSEGLTRREIQDRTLFARYQVFRNISYGLSVALCIIASWVPLQAIQPLADTLAGKRTSVSVAIGLTASFSLAIVGGGVAMWVKLRRQRDEIIRLRTRLQVLEELGLERMETTGAKPSGGGR
jgi:hypothetical protein